MKATTTAIEDKVEELLGVLDTDIEHLQQSMSRLNEMRSLVIKHDDGALGRLLESIQAEANGYRKHAFRRRSVLKELAIALGCDQEQMTLSKLEARLNEEQKAQVAERKVQLRSLSKELKREHLSTQLLLSECARFNSMLLKSIFDFGKTGTVIYNCDGSTKRHTDTAFVSVQF